VGTECKSALEFRILDDISRHLEIANVIEKQGTYLREVILIDAQNISLTLTDSLLEFHLLFSLVVPILDFQPVRVRHLVWNDDSLSPIPPTAKACDNVKCAFLGHEQQEEKIVSLEKQGWEAIKKKDWNALGGIMTEEFVEVGKMGIRGKSEALQDLNLILTEYAMEQVKVLELSKDAALLAYQLVQKGSYKGQDLPSKIICGLCPAWREVAQHLFQETRAK